MRAAWLGLIGVAVLAVSAGAQETQDAWVRDAEAGLTRARFSGRAAVLIFSADWCGYCEKFEAFFVDPKVAPISKKTVLVIVDVAANPETMRKYNVESHHVAVIIGWDRRELGRLNFDDGPDKMIEAYRVAVCTNELDAAAVLLKVDRYGKAAERAQGVLEVLKEGPLADKANKIIAEAAKHAQEALDAARQMLKEEKLVLP